jgi:hypothetical protein
MKGTWAWLAGGFGLVALVRGVRRSRPAQADGPTTRAAEPVVDDPGRDRRAEELRAKLDEAKAAGSDRDEFDAGETPVDAAESVLDFEARRRSVHEEARSALDEMRGGPGDSAA